MKVSLSGKWVLRFALGLCAVVLAVWGGMKGYYILTHVSTDDAFVDGDVATISAQVGGLVVAVAADDYRRVEAGDLLLLIDSRDYAIALGLQEARYEELQAEYRELLADEERQKSLVAGAKASLEAARQQKLLDDKTLSRDYELLRKNALAQSQYDEAFTRHAVAGAQLRVAEQAVRTQETELTRITAQQATQATKIEQGRYGVEQARLDLDRTEARAPWRGSVANRSAVAGKYVQPGQALLTLVKDDNLWITANFKETQVTGMRAGDPVDVNIDAFSGPAIRGRVQSFQPGTGATFSLLPPENATGNFVKIVQRIPVRILLDSSDVRIGDLKIGMSATVHVSGGSRSEAQPGSR